MAEGSVIGRGSIIRGNVHGEGNLEIHGRVEGDVTVTGDVTLGEEALVRGNITGAQVSVAGAVQGDLRGNEAVLIERGGRVIGELTSPRIGIAPGALVKGNVRTDGEAPLTVAQRRPGATQSSRAASGPASVPRSAVSARVEPLRIAPAPPSATVERFSDRPAAVERASAAPALEREEPEEREPESEPASIKREAPPPLVPALAKGAKAKKKKA